MESNQKHPYLGYIYVFLATAFWSGNFIVSKGLADQVPPVTIAMSRWTIALILFLPFGLKLFLRNWRNYLPHWKYILIVSFLGISLFNTLIYIAGHSTSSFNMSLISLSSPIFILVFSSIFLKTSIARHQLISIFVILFGVIFLISKGNLSQLLNIDYNIGDLWMIISAITFSIYTILLKNKPPSISVNELLFVTFLIGVILLVPFFVWEFSIQPTNIFQPDILLPFLYIGMFCSLICYYLWNQAIEMIGTNNAAIIYYLIPIFTGILGLLFLGEQITKIQVLSMLVIMIGLGYNILTEKRISKS